MKKVLKIVSHSLLTLLFVGYIAYQFRTDPIAVISGKQLSGDEVAYPADWAFTNDFETVAVEARPGNPHSVTTVCFLVNGDLYIPARNGSSKDWPAYVLNDSRVRIKVGELVYPAMMTRILDPDMTAVREAIAAKYPQFADASPTDQADVWFFRVSDR